MCAIKSIYDSADEVQSPWRQDLWSHLPRCQGLRSYSHRTPGKLNTIEIIEDPSGERKRSVTANV